MRPDTSSDPTVELVEEFSNVGAFVILAPTSQNRIQLGNQLAGAQGHATLGPLPHLILETTNRLLSGIRIQCPRAHLATDLARRKPQGLPAFDLVTKKLEAVLDVHDPCLLRMEYHAQLFQDSESRGHRRPRLGHGLAGYHPVVRVPRELISPASHLPIKRRQENVTEQG